MEVAAIAFVLVMLAVAYIVFRLLKRAVKMAVRAMIVMLILFIAGAGGITLWMLDPGGDRPPATKKKR